MQLAVQRVIFRGACGWLLRWRSPDSEHRKTVQAKTFLQLNILRSNNRYSDKETFLYGCVCTVWDAAVVENRPVRLDRHKYGAHRRQLHGSVCMRTGVTDCWVQWHTETSIAENICALSMCVVVFWRETVCRKHIIVTLIKGSANRGVVRPVIK